MKFSCDRCNTRYSIGDEKVRGKVLKIRCKTCGNIMVVREGGAAITAVESVPQPVAIGASNGNRAAPAPVTTGSDRAAVPAPVSGVGKKPLGIDWYVAIRGQQHGPVKSAEIVRLLGEGRISERSYCWNESMSAWTRLRDAPEFKAAVEQHLAQKAAAAAPQKKTPPPPPDEQGAEVVSLDAARKERAAREAAALGQTPSSAQAPDPFAALAAQSGAMNQPIDAPRDSTRVFIMNAGLANRSSKHRVYAVAAGICVAGLAALMALDYFGVVEIPGLHRVVIAVEPSRSQNKGIELAAWDEEEDKNVEMKCKLNPSLCTQIREESQVRKAARHRAAKKVEQVEEAPREVGRATTGGEDPFKSSNVESQKIAEVFRDDRRGAVKAPTATVETPQVASNNIDVEAVNKVVKQNFDAVKGCMDQAAKAGETVRGKQYLTITLRPNGVVGAAWIKDHAVNAQPVGQCITGVAKRWKFAPFPGEATDIEIPLILSVN